MRAAGHGRQRGRASRRQALVELAGELVRGAALDRAQGRSGRPAGRVERYDIRSFPGRGLGADRYGTTPRRQVGEAGDVTTDSEAAIAAKAALAIEHRKSGQLDRKRLAAVVDRPGDA